MSTLTNTRIKDTYKGLIKLIDNNAITSSDKEITDGFGNPTGIFMNNSGNLTIEGNFTSQGIIDSSGANKISFFFDNQAAFPNATTYHGAIAHSHADGKMYFAHSGAWVELALASDIVAGQSLSADGTSILNTADVLSVNDLGISTGKIQDDAITTIKVLDLNITTDKIADSNITTGKVADDAITNAKLGAEYTASVALTSGTNVTVDTSLGDVFTMTAAASHTFNFTNVVIGDMKTLEITGSGASLTSAFGTVNSSSCTFNKIGGEYSDDAAKQIIQVKFTALNNAWYQISQIAS